MISDAEIEKRLDETMEMFCESTNPKCFKIIKITYREFKHRTENEIYTSCEQCKEEGYS